MRKIKLMIWLGLLLSSTLWAQPGQDINEVEDKLQWAWTSIEESQNSVHFLLESLANGALNNPQEVQKLIKNFDKPHLEFFSEMDEYILDKYDFFINRAASAADQIHAQVEASGNASKAVKKLRSRLVRLKAAYDENRSQFGKGKDNQRTSAFRDFFKTYEEYLRAVDGDGYRLWKIGTKIKGFVKALKYAKLVPRAPRFLWEVYQPLSRQSPNQTTPVVNELFGSIIAGIGEVNGYKVAVHGQENIVTKHEAGTVTIYTPNHVTRIPDQVALAATGIKDFNIMTNFSVPGLTNRSATLTGVTFVGNKVKEKEDPTEKVLRLASEGTLHTFIIYPQGASSGGLFDLMGVRESFVTGVVQGLHARGLKVRIVPISYPKNAFLLNKAEASHVFEAIIHKPLEPDVVRALTENGDPQVLARVMRAIWQADQVIEGDLFALQPRVSSLREMLQKDLSRGTTGPISCRDLLGEIR